MSDPTEFWFGIASSTHVHAQWMVAPPKGVRRRPLRSYGALDFQGAGSAAKLTYPHRWEYSLAYPVQSSLGASGLDAFHAFASGLRGAGWIYMVDPYVENVYPMQWSSPGIIELDLVDGRGWKPIGSAPMTFSNTPANSLGLPVRSATWNVSWAAGSPPPGQNSVFTYLIPPNKSLWLGGVGSVTGAGVWRVVPVLTNGSLGTPVNVTLAGVGSTVTLAAEFPGDTFQAVRVSPSRSSASAGTVTVSGQMAKLTPLGQSAPVLDRFIPGGGVTGMWFGADSLDEVYIRTNPNLKGMSIVLEELEQWA